LSHQYFNYESVDDYFEEKEGEEETYLIFVATITNAGCVKNLGKC
jgi:hypothetical protein